MDNETRNDLQMVKFAALAVFWLLLVYAVIRIVVPGLVNMHNDGALILAIVMVLGISAATFLYAKALYRNFKIMKGDTN